MLYYRYLTLNRVASILVSLILLTGLFIKSALASFNEDSLVFVASPLPGKEENLGISPAVDTAYTNFLGRNFRLTNPVSNNNAADFEQQLLNIESAQGAFALDLAEILHSLGMHYMANQDYENAFASFQREEHIHRINFGLNSDTQVSAMKGQIRALKAGGKTEEANDKYLSLIYLLEKSHERYDPGLMPELVAFGEWSLASFHEKIRYEVDFHPLMAFSQGIKTKEDVRVLAFDQLDQASIYFARAAEILVHNNEFADPALYQMENRLVEAAYIQAHRREVLADPDNYQNMVSAREEMYKSGSFARLTRDAYKYGIGSYERQLLYIQKDENGSLGRYVDTLLAFGDWYLLFGKFGSSKKLYQEAMDLLRSYNLKENTIIKIMQPEVPVAIPTFTATPHSLQSLEQKGEMLNPYRGYIDVSFTINGNGNARNIEVLTSTDDTPARLERRLVKTIQNTRYRPRLDLDKATARDDVVSRYYYTW